MGHLRPETMSRTAPVSLLALLLTLWTMPGGAEAKYAHGARRTGHRLMSDESPPLEQRQVNSVQQCLALCDRVAGCVALNYGTVSSTTNCQLLGQRACEGLLLVADPTVDYYDVYDDDEDRAAERLTPFWDDPGCVQDGYCAVGCAADAVGGFCSVDQHCSAKLKPPGEYRCVDGACQRSAGFWELRTGLALPRWQLWTMDESFWTWKRLKPDICSLDIRLKLGVGTAANIKVTWTDDHTHVTQIHFVLTTTYTVIIFHDSAGVRYELVPGAAGMVSSDDYNPLTISWCGGALAIGPPDNPTLVTAQADISRSIEYVTVFSPVTPSWMYVNSGLADRWLFDDTGLAPHAVMVIGPETYALRKTSATNDVTVKYDCMAEGDCHVYLRGSNGSPRSLIVCVGYWGNSRSALFYGGVVEPMLSYETGPVLSPTEFNTFTVRYNNGSVTVYRNNASTPMYAVQAPYLVRDITLIGIGGCCIQRSVRVARYDPAWRTDTWLTEGRGYSNGDRPELT